MKTSRESIHHRQLEAGEHEWYVVARNNIGFSPPSQARTFEACSGVAIGDCSEDLGLPIDHSQRYNYSQSIILQSEIEIANQRIDKIAFYWNGQSSSFHGCDWVVYMGHTNKAQFADLQDWIPMSELTQVYEGNFVIPSVTGWFELELDYPFLYNRQSGDRRLRENDYQVISFPAFTTPQFPDSTEVWSIAEKSR